MHSTVPSQVPATTPRAGLDGRLVAHALKATRASAIAAAGWAGRGSGEDADRAATDAMRRVLRRLPGRGTVVTGEGAKDEAPMLADGEQLGAGGADFDIAVDPLECTSLCAAGLPGALSTIALAPRGSMWCPGPAFYMDKLVVAAGAVGVATITDPPERVARDVAAGLAKPLRELRVVVLDKPRHRELIKTLRAIGAVVATPIAGDIAGSLSVLLAEGEADLLLGVGGTPEGVMTACAARALGGDMQARVAPQRPDESERVADAGIVCGRVLTRDDLIGADGAFIATGVTGGLLAAPRRVHGSLVTESLVIAGGAVQIIQHSSPPEE